MKQAKSSEVGGVVFARDAVGGFVAGDTKTRVTAYAYPSSPNAVAARLDPRGVAADMLAQENLTFTLGGMRSDYDRANWEVLDHEHEVAPSRERKHHFNFWHRHTETPLPLRAAEA